MSGYGLSYESSFGLQRVEADNKSLGSRASHASSRVGDMTTNEGLLADMRLEIAGDNILQSYGSSGEIDGQQWSRCQDYIPAERVDECSEP